ncbi:hypothetical protein L9F63_013808, partial [Diploptera punctata]
MYWKGRFSLISRYAFQKYTHSRPPQCPPCHEEKSSLNFWRTISFALIPIIGIITFSQFMNLKKHKHAEPFVPYEHLRIRNKRFPWGDGQKSLFHNPDTNALPNGYEPGRGPPVKKSKKEVVEEEE